MEYSAVRRGAAVVGVWCAALGGLVCLPFWKSRFLPTLAALALWLAVCFGVVAPRLASGTVRLGGNHLTLRRGKLFLTTRRIPLRFVTGCQIIQTPLQRLSGTCIFLLFTSGCTAAAPGLLRADAEALSARLTHGGRLL